LEANRYNLLGSQILDACIQVHKELGPGLLESVYHYALMKEFEWRGIRVDSKVFMPLVYKGHETGKHFEIDMVVEKGIIIELKSVDVLHPVFEAQLITYLKLADLRLGYLVNFNVPVLKSGFKRFVNKF